MPEEVYFNDRLQCVPCGLQFDSEELLQQHTEITHGDRVLPENISLNDIDSEIEDEANNDLFVEREDIKINSVGCKNCKESFVNLIDLEAHLNAHSETINKDGKN